MAMHGKPSQAAGKPRRRGPGVGKAVKKKKTKLTSIKNQIRGVQRLLAKAGSDLKIRQKQEERLQQLLTLKEQHDKAELERKYAKRYHKVRFFERVKIERQLHKLQKQASAAEVSVKEQSQLEQLKEDLQYVLHFPKGEKYVSLLKDAPTPEEQARLEGERSRLRALVRQQLAEAALVGEADEGRSLARKAAVGEGVVREGGDSEGSEGEGAGVDDDDDFFLHSGSSGEESGGEEEEQGQGHDSSGGGEEEEDSEEEGVNSSGSDGESAGPAAVSAAAAAINVRQKQSMVAGRGADAARAAFIANAPGGKGGAVPHQKGKQQRWQQQLAGGAGAAPAAKQARNVPPFQPQRKWESNSAAAGPGRGQQRPAGQQQWQQLGKPAHGHPKHQGQQRQAPRQPHKPRHPAAWQAEPRDGGARGAGAAQAAEAAEAAPPKGLAQDTRPAKPMQHGMKGTGGGKGKRERVPEEKQPLRKRAEGGRKRRKKD